MKIDKKYLGAFFILLLVEIFIALFVKDNFIRPYVGDILVIIVLYTLIRGFVGKRIRFLPIYLFLFGVLVEFLQYINIVKILNLHNSKFFRILIGTSFDIKDIVCYLIGTIILILWEKFHKD